MNKKDLELVITRIKLEDNLTYASTVLITLCVIGTLDIITPGFNYLYPMVAGVTLALFIITISEQIRLKRKYLELIKGVK